MSRQRGFWHPRGVLCAVCRRPARGFGWIDPGKRKSSAPPRWFCSIGCQGFWWRSRLCDLSEAQVLTLIEVAVGGFQDAMQAVSKSSGEEIPF